MKTTAARDLWDVDALIAELEVTYQATHHFEPSAKISNVVTKCSTCETDCPGETGVCDTGSVWGPC